MLYNNEGTRNPNLDLLSSSSGSHLWTVSIEKVAKIKLLKAFDSMNVEEWFKPRKI